MDAHVLHKLTNFVVIKLLVIVCDDGLWTPKVKNNVLPQKIYNLRGHNSCNRLCLSPFGEVTNGNNTTLHLSNVGRSALIKPRPYMAKIQGFMVDGAIDEGNLWISKLS